MTARAPQQLRLYRGHQPIRVVIVESRARIRRELKSLLEQETDMEVVGAPRLVEKAMHLIRERRPDVVLMEASVSVEDSLRVCREIRGQHEDIRVIFFADVVDAELVREAVNAGASGYLATRSIFWRAPLAIKAVAQNRSYFDWTAVQLPVQEWGASPVEP